VDLRSLYDRATFSGDESAIEQSLGVVSSLEADLSMARGRLAHARFLTGSEPAEADRGELAQFERAAELYDRVPDERGLAEALLWIGIAHQVVGGKPRGGIRAAPPLLRARRTMQERPFGRRGGNRSSDSGDQLTGHAGNRAYTTLSTKRPRSKV
jgi:hypothetical protein